jgi:hypothetical protein
MSRLKANRPFARGWLGQRVDLTLTNAPLGEAVVADSGLGGRGQGSDSDSYGGRGRGSDSGLRSTISSTVRTAVAWGIIGRADRARAVALDQILPILWKLTD